MRHAKKINLIEGVITVVFLVGLAVVVMIAIDPAKTMADVIDGQRREDIMQLSKAIDSYQQERGDYPPGLDTNAETGQVLGVSGSDCDKTCSAMPTRPACLDISGQLITEYLSAIPFDPESGDFLNTDYYVNVTESGKVLVGACDPTNVSTINVLR